MSHKKLGRVPKPEVKSGTVFFVLGGFATTPEWLQVSLSCGCGTSACTSSEEEHEESEIFLSGR